MLLDEPEASALCLDGVDDVFNGLNGKPKEMQYRLAGDDPNILKRYKEGEIHLVLKISSNECPDFEFLIAAIPYRHCGYTDHSTDPFNTVEGRTTADSENGVFVGIGYFVNSPQGVIPSYVWLERPKERVKWQRHIATPTFHAVLEFSSTTSEGERSVRFGFVRESSQEGDAIASAIESRAKVVNSFFQKVGNAVGNWFVEPEFVNLVLRVIRISLSKWSVWASREESADLDFKIRQVQLCPGDFTA